MAVICCSVHSFFNFSSVALFLRSFVDSVDFGRPRFLVSGVSGDPLARSLDPEKSLLAAARRSASA